MMKDFNDYSLLRHNTFGIDVHCLRYIEYASTDEAVQACALLRASENPFLIIGAGSNLLLTKDFEGIVVSAEKRFEVSMQADLEHPESVLLACWAGTIFDDVVAYAVSKGWHGAENLSLIPGQVGASAVQNIGAYGAEACNIIERIEAVEIATGKIVDIKGVDCAYSYRQSKFKQVWKNRYLITRVIYRMSNCFEPQLGYGNIKTRLEEQGIVNPTAAQVRETVIAIRREKLPDPAVEGNAGSFFMNPVVDEVKFKDLQKQYPDIPYYIIKSVSGSSADAHYKIPAAWMIDRCGWKGRSVGAVGVHVRQPLVLVNKGGATGQDVLNLCLAIQKDVQEKFGIALFPEVNIQ